MTFLQKNHKLKEFWIDSLKMQIHFNENKKIPLFWLSFNSDFLDYDNETRLQLTPNSIYDFFVEVIDKPTLTRLGFFLINKIPKKSGEYFLKNKIEITGQWFILRDLGFYFELLHDLKFEFYKGDIERVDIASDYICNTDELCKNVFLPKLENVTKHIFEKKWIIETLYIWNKDKKQNPYQLIRIYNKKLDSKKKGKLWLYDFEKEKDYTRIEIEMREDKAKYIEPMDLLSLEYLFVVFCKNIHKFSYDFFKKFTYDDFKNWLRIYNKNKDDSLYYQRKEKLLNRQKAQDLYGSDFISKEEEERFLQNFIKTVKRLWKNWYNMQDILHYLKKSWIYEQEFKEFFEKNPLNRDIFKKKDIEKI